MYLKSPDLILANAGKQFIAHKFKQYFRNMGIIVKKVLVKANHSIKLLECYDSPLRQFYTIITTEILGIKPKLAFQMFFKAFNNLIGVKSSMTLF